ncbi:MAG: hypothetical protein DIU60_007975 [Actinomycetes bacterium]
MTGDTHYDLETLAELAEGLLDDATAQQVRDHLAICDPCGEALADLAGVREVLAAMPVPAMPLGVALRVDKALAAEAERRRAGGPLDPEPSFPEPDWDRIMADAPWETGAPWDEPAAPAGERVADLPPLESPRMVPLTAASAEEAVPATVNGAQRPASPAREASADEAGTMVPLPVSATRLDEPAADERPEPAPAAASAAGDAGAERPALGVVAEDGSVVRPKRRTGSARRRWLVSLSSVAAAAAVVAGGFTVTNTVVADGAQTERQTVAAPSTPAEPSQETLAADVDEPRERASRFVIGESGYNYADAELKANLVAYFGSMPSGGSATSDAKLNRCISKLVADEKRDPIGIDRAYYNGNEALIMLFWHDRSQDLVKVRVVSPECKNLRKPGLATWN